MRALLRLNSVQKPSRPLAFSLLQTSTVETLTWQLPRSCRPAATSVRRVTWRTACGCCTRALWPQLTPRDTSQMSQSLLRFWARPLCCASSGTNTTSGRARCGESASCSIGNVICMEVLKNGGQGPLIRTCSIWIGVDAAGLTLAWHARLM